MHTNFSLNRTIRIAHGSLIALAALAAALALPAQAAEPQTRSQVLNELKQARADGSLGRLSAEAEIAAPLTPLISVVARSRAEVVAELVRARAEGSLQAENEVDPFTTQRLAEARARQQPQQFATAGR